MITRDSACLTQGLSGKLLQGCLNEHLRGVEKLTRLRDAYRLRAAITRRTRADGLPNNRLSHAYVRYIVTIASA